jgi:hypothetical protein
MLTRGVLSNGSAIPYASGITHGTFNGLPTISHGGSDAGYRAMFLRFPEQRFGVSVLCNIATANPGDLANRVAAIYLADRMTRPTAPPEEPEVAVAPEDLAKFTGAYWNAASAAFGQFVAENGRLYFMQGGQRMPLVPIGPGRFVLRPQRTYFTFDGSRLRSGGSPNAGEWFERVELFKPSGKALEEFAGAYRSEELDIVYRLRVDGETLKLERLKNRAASLTPQLADTFGSAAGTLRFTRDSAGRIDGFVLEAGRVRGLRFRRM